MTRKYLNLHDFNDLARRRLPRAIYRYIEGGSEEGASLRGNREAFDRLRFMPRTLVDVSARSTAVTTLGTDWAAPIGIAPMGGLGLAAFQADLALATAAGKARIPYVLSTSSLVAMERVLRANPAAWFQAYLSTERLENERFLTRIGQAGFETLMITVDVPVAGNREENERNGFISPMTPSLRLAIDGASHPRWLITTLLRSLLSEGLPHFVNLPGVPVPAFSTGRVRQRPHGRDDLCWDDLKRMRDQWPHRLLLKGVLAPQDMAAARAAGVDGVIVSNHGGRQLDGALAPLCALPEVVAAAGAVPVLLDGGVRRGTDVLKAMALGAAHVFVGRPFAYAAVAGGVDGVLRAIDILRAEISADMAMLGCVGLNQVGAHLIRPERA